MYIIEFPNVVETFHRALNEVLSPFLSTGNSGVFMDDIPVIFYDCDIFYNNDLFRDEEPHTKPFICIVGSKMGGIDAPQKIADPKGFRPYAYEARRQITRSVFVGIGRSLEFNPPPYEDPATPRQANMRDAENIWSQLSLILENKWKDFNDRGIYQPTIPSIPAEVQHKDYYLLMGQLNCGIRYTFTRGN